jgi:hypothetical protein
VEKPFQVDEYKETTESGAAPALTPYLALPPADAYDREATFSYSNVSHLERISGRTYCQHH